LITIDEWQAKAEATTTAGDVKAKAELSHSKAYGKYSKGVNGREGENPFNKKCPNFTHSLALI
jgi:hypothetical protein